MITQDFTRHKVKVRHTGLGQSRLCPYTFSCQFADYPAILPYERSKMLLGRELTVEERSVRGTLVAGLTLQDIRFLDMFEGFVRGV